MTLANWIAIASVCVVMCGWFIISALNRKNEIAKERLKFRLDILFSILDAFNEAQRLVVISEKIQFNDKEYVANLTRALSRLVLFGKQDEVRLCNSVFEKLKEGQPVGKELTMLAELVSERIKAELAIR